MKRVRIHKGRLDICPVCNPEAARRYQAQLKKKKFIKKEDSDVDSKERVDYRNRRNAR